LYVVVSHHGASARNEMEPERRTKLVLRGVKSIFTVSPPPTRVPSEANDRESLEVVCHEYDAIRAEIVTSLTSQVSVLSFGSATVGLLVAAAAALWEKEVWLTAAILLFVIPSICFLTLAIYGGELVRMMRAGLFMNRLEKWINEVCVATGLSKGHQGRTLTWEQWGSIRTGRGDVDLLNRIAISAVFLGMAIGGIVVGFIRVHIDARTPELWAIGALGLSVAVGIGAMLWLIHLLLFAYTYRSEYLYSPPEEVEQSARVPPSPNPHPGPRANGRTSASSTRAAN